MLQDLLFMAKTLAELGLDSEVSVLIWMKKKRMPTTGETTVKEKLSQSGLGEEIASYVVVLI